MNTSKEDTPIPQVSRGQVARDMLVFQAKLFTDGVKDLLLSPLSLMAGLLGIFFSLGNPGKPLYTLLRFGKRMEGWINLFSAAYPADVTREGDLNEESEGVHEGDKPATQDFDSLVDKLQAALTDPDARSRLSDQSKSQLVAMTKKLRGEQDQGR